MVLVSVLGSVPTVGTNEQAILGISAYALSFAVSLLSGLCLVSSVYAPHYIKVILTPMGHANSAVRLG